MNATIPAPVAKTSKKSLMLKILKWGAVALAFFGVVFALYKKFAGKKKGKAKKLKGDDKPKGGILGMLGLGKKKNKKKNSSSEVEPSAPTNSPDPAPRRPAPIHQHAQPLPQRTPMPMPTGPAFAAPATYSAPVPRRPREAVQAEAQIVALQRQLREMREEADRQSVASIASGPRSTPAASSLPVMAPREQKEEERASPADPNFEPL
jgi:hypothetical protein